MSAAQTRAQELGVKPSKLRKATLTQVRKVRAAAEAIGALWGDIDQGMVNVGEDLERRATEIESEMEESFRILAEPY